MGRLSAWEFGASFRCFVVAVAALGTEVVFPSTVAGGNIRCGGEVSSGVARRMGPGSDWRWPGSESPNSLVWCSPHWNVPRQLINLIVEQNT